MDNHEEKVKNWITLERLLEGRQGEFAEMYFDLIATHTTKISGKAAFRKQRRRKPVSELVSVLDEALARVQLYNRWDAWMFEMPQDACASIKEGKKPNRRVKKYDNPDDCPKAKLSGKDEDSGGRFTGWRYRESNREMKKQIKLVKEDREKGAKVEEKHVEIWRDRWRKSQKNPNKPDVDEEETTGKSLEHYNNGNESEAEDGWEAEEV